ncbi:MAG TPA: glycosyltransferase, partial [Nitrospirales bacterium]|nr:glycosyltransferase [Nitrospirales bacterium]
MTATLIITTFNWKEALELVLLSIKQQSLMPCKVIIADDGSRDDTRELIDRMIPEMPVPIRHLWH